MFQHPNNSTYTTKTTTLKKQCDIYLLSHTKLTVDHGVGKGSETFGLFKKFTSEKILFICVTIA